jgi:hypothetical protein
MNRFNRILGLIAMSFSCSAVYSQVAKSQTIPVEIKVNSDGLNFNFPSSSSTSTYNIFYRPLFKQVSTFNTLTSGVPGSSVLFEVKSSNDINQITKENNPFEYILTKTENGSTTALGYSLSGVKYNPPVNRKHVILLIDSSYLLALNTELDQLVEDLYFMGWQVSKVFAGRNESAETVKERLKKHHYSQIKTPETLFIIGHVPVPYSGYFSSQGTKYPPDGHAEGSGNHTGAWPADSYYGDFEGIWTDRNVTCTTGTQTRHHNIPKDGKFDQSVIPSDVVLEIGRADFFNMSAFSNNDTALTKQYLNRIHDWRLGKISMEKRALIDNNFTGLNLASTGYQNLPCFVGLDSVFDDRDYFTAQKQGSYLWSYGCGAGSYTSCNGIGSTTDFVKAKDSFQNAFTILAGSYFGDFDVKNSLLKAPLLTGSLNCFWGGIPKWYVHHMALGSNIGFGAMITMNNTTEYFNGQFNGSDRGVFISLMGDPTITLAPPQTISNLTASSNNGKVQLNWTASPDADFYEVYLLDTSNKAGHIKNLRKKDFTSYTTNFSDDENWTSGKFEYLVCAVRLDTTGAGTYYNRSKFMSVKVDHVNSLRAISDNTIKIYPNPSGGKVHLKGFPTEKISIFNVQGQLIKEVKLNESKLYLELNLEDLMPGMYWISACNQTQTITKPLIIE